jgi:hypothetical protein
MLAYVFWHWADSAVAAGRYEELLRAFHRALVAHPPEGFRGAAALRAAGAGWLPQGRGYEDWYLLDDFAALGTLNEAAVSEGRQAPHDRVAQQARGGTAGIYRLIAGRPEFTAMRWATWISKPAGSSYSGFYDELRPWPERPETTLWQRQLTLGPTSEFCLQSRERVDLPEPFRAAAVEMTPLWSDLISR